MAIIRKPITDAAATPVEAPAPRKRNRAPIVLTVPTEDSLVTYVMNIEVTNAGKLYDIVHTVGAQQGFTREQVDARISVNHIVDVGECIKFLLDEPVSALAAVTGFQVGVIEAYLEIPSPPD